MSIKVVCTNISKISGTDRQYLVEWDFSDANKKKKWGSEHLPSSSSKIKKTIPATDHFKVRWEYKVKRAGSSTYEWLIGSDENVDSGSLFKSTYTPPDYATSIRVKVKPVSKTYTYKSDNKTKTAHYYTGEYTAWKTKAVNNLSNDPVQPKHVGEPEVKMTTNGGIRISLKVTDILPEDNTDSVIFTLIAGDTKFVEKDIDKSITYQTATCEFEDVEPGHTYKIGVKAKNKSTGEVSDVVYTSDIKVMPPSVYIEEISVRSENQIFIKLSGTNGFAESYQVRGSYKENAFNLNDESAITTWTFENGKRYGVITIDAEHLGYKWHFQGRAVNSAGPSKWSDSEWTKILSKRPAAPTTWSSCISAEVDKTITLYWTHNPEDGSAQEMAKVTLVNEDGNPTAHFRYRVKGSSGWTTTTLAAGNTRDILVNNTKDDYEEWKKETLYVEIQGSSSFSIQWYVKTKGLNENLSPISIKRDIKVYDKPVVSVGVVGSLSSYPINFKITSTDNLQIPLSYTFEIIAAESYESTASIPVPRVVNRGDVVYREYSDVVDKKTRVTILPELKAGDAALENNITYWATATFSYDSGLVVSQTVSFIPIFEDVDIPEPELMGVAYDLEDYSYSFKPCCLEWDDDGNYMYVSNVIMSVYRLLSDGSYILVKDNLTNKPRETNVKDPHPAINYQTYRVVATSIITGLSSYSDVTVDMFPRHCMIIQWSDSDYSYDIYDDESGFEHNDSDPYILKLPFNIKVSETGSSDAALVEYIGRKHPVSYYGTQQGLTRTFYTEIPKEDAESYRYSYDRNDTISKLRRLISFPGDVYIREPSGLGSWAKVDIHMSTDYDSLIIPVNITVTPVEGGL